jgi:hypothetical protein
MSGHDAAPDPIDEAYVRAEAMLSDDAARAARRARVLAAVGRVPAASMAAAAAAAPLPAPARRRSTWRPGGWLAAACVAGLSVFLAVKLYQPAQLQPQTPPAAPAPAATAAPAPSVLAPTAATSDLKVLAPKARGTGALAEPPAPAPPPEGFARQVTAPVSPAKTPAPAPADIAPIAPPPPAAPIVAQAPRAFPAATPPPPPEAASERPEPAPAEKAADSSAGRDEVAAVQGGLSARASRRATFAEAPLDRAERESESTAATPSDQAERLRAAAAAGRTAEVETLLGQGAPVDAPDAAGDTALIKSLQADHPAAAAALRRHGASLDHKNLAGKSARDIVTTKGDPELNQAVGLGP